jgi:transposase
LARRHHELVALRTQAAGRLHTLLSFLAEGRFPLRIRAEQALTILGRIRPVSDAGIERKRQARLLAIELRRFEHDLDTLSITIRDAVAASGTTVTEIHGVGPIMAAYIIGHSRDIHRFRDAGHYARYNGTAPVSASTSAKNLHRLNRNGNRQLNHALHVAAVTQVGHDTPGREYYRRKIAEGKTRKAALRSLKRRISDAVYHQLLIDARR